MRLNDLFSIAMRGKRSKKIVEVVEKFKELITKKYER